MQFALLIYSREADLPDQMSEADREAFYGSFGEFNQAIEAAGSFVTARRLETVDAAATVRMRNENAVVTDGPFAETKECLAGFFLVECEDREEALGWARRIPSARIGSVEVRPIRRS